jgi:hypothetical protein
MARQKFTGTAGLPLPRRAVKVLKERGLFAHAMVSVEHQQLAQRYVVRGLESGGSAGDVGRYITFARQERKNHVSGRTQANCGSPARTLGKMEGSSANKITKRQLFVGKTHLLPRFPQFHAQIFRFHAENCVDINEATV